MAFRPGNWKLRGLNVRALLEERWQLATRNNFSRNSAGERENGGEARREQSSYPLSAEVLVSNPTFHQFPKPSYKFYDIHTEDKHGTVSAKALFSFNSPILATEWINRGKQQPQRNHSDQPYLRHCKCSKNNRNEAKYIVDVPKLLINSSIDNHIEPERVLTCPNKMNSGINSVVRVKLYSYLNIVEWSSVNPWISLRQLLENQSKAFTTIVALFSVVKKIYAEKYAKGSQRRLQEMPERVIGSPGERLNKAYKSG
ncbi:hypothetical protein WN51_07991 [Melipona quadrifasciata]|uniref:Uncharacterized protein n=1 Tax=Melipona quadrifasciata TaxID=166423 RepID=A0A0N0BBP6_9HYME|nr:hypothetical protein WN51_07991 [Melipona quadrifasciata]